MKKKIKRISVLVLLGMMVLVLCAPGPSAQTWTGGIYSDHSIIISVDCDDNASDEVFTVWHDGGPHYNPPGEELFRIQEDGKVGIKTQDPTNMLDVNGSARVRDLQQNDTLNDIVVADANGVLHTRDVNTIGSTQNIITVSDDYKPESSDYTILVDASSNHVTIELPSTYDAYSQILVIKRIDDEKNEVTIDADGSETIDGDLTVTLNVKFMSYTIQSDGSSWYIIASYGFMGRSHIGNGNR